MPGSQTLDDPIDGALALDDPLGALVLALMSRLLATRAAGALVDGEGLRVEVVKGPVDVAEGVCLDGPVGDGLPAALAEAGLVLALPLRHGGDALGLVALGPKLGGADYTPAEVGLARSLAGATAASLAARQSAAALAAANRHLAARAHALRTLFELAQAFGRALDREAIVSRLAYALMGQLLVRRVAVALCDSDEGPVETVLTRGAPPVTVPRAICRLDAPAALRDEALRAEGWAWAIPLRAGDVTRGAVLLGPPATAGEDWTPDADTTDFTAALAALAVGALETADRVDERVERERLREEVRLAREVQARLLPTELPTYDGLEVAARWRPSRDVSGDTYHVADLGGTLLVAVADVVGKGIGASLLMATLQAGFRLVEPDLRDADDLGAALEAATIRLDSLVHASTEAHQFVTLAWAVVDPATGDVVSVVAGHPAPRIRRRSGRVGPMAGGGPLLGVLPGVAFTASRCHLDPGDALVFYTDGATEAQDAAGEELGPEGLDWILRDPHDGAVGLVAGVTAAVDAWAAAGKAEDDDLTLVAVQRTGGPSV